MQSFKKPKKIYEEVADELVNRIQRGEVKPGDRLPSVEQLSKEFQVGRSAIREALSALRAKGILEMRQGEGTFVKNFDPKVLSSSISTSTILMDKKDIQDLLELRKIIELGSVVSAIKHASKADLLELQHALEDMKNAKGNEELGDKADLRFHLGIAKASSNKLLFSLMEQVSELMGEAMRETRRIWIFSEETSLEKIYLEHKAIYDAIIDKQEERAQSLLLAHLTSVEETLLKHTTVTK